MHRIECVPCGNRAFSNKEALQQHLKSSSSYHPVCERCDKRFSSESGLEAHMVAKHPPTFDCERCARSYKQSFALEDHYRGSPVHPNCGHCGKGFKDHSELEIHRSTAHVQKPCMPCGGVLVYEDQVALERHYGTSDHHPKCTKCGKGCYDESALSSHLEIAHSSELGGPATSICAVPSSLPLRHLAIARNASIPREGTRPLEYHTGSTSISPEASSFLNLNTFGSIRTDTPELRVSMAFSSPLLGVQLPPFSPNGLVPPGREVNELWSSKQNIQVPPGQRSPEVVKTQIRVSPDVVSQADLAPEAWGDSKRDSPNVSGEPFTSTRSYHTPTVHSTSTTFPSPIDPIQRWDQRLRSEDRLYLDHRRGLSTNSLPQLPSEGNNSSSRSTSPTRSVASTVVGRPSRTSYSSPSRGSTIPTTDVTPSKQSTLLPAISHPYTFNSRLYPGFARAALRHTAKGKSTELVAPNGLRWTAKQSEAHPDAVARTMQFLMAEEDGLGDEFGTATPKVTGSPKNPSSSLALSAEVTTSSGSDVDVGGSSPSSFSVSSSETCFTSEGAHVTPVPDDPHALQLICALPECEDEEMVPERFDSSVLGDANGHLPAPVVTVSTRFESSVFRSPDVGSPVDLAFLPSVSPLLETTMGLDSSFEWPETKHPLPESGPPSPASLPPASPLSTIFDASADSHTGDSSHEVQEAEELTGDSLVDQAFNLLPVLETGPVSPAKSMLSAEELSPKAAPRTPAKLSPLHCRECKADVADDITATMCGHIFCNRCIVQAVIKSSRCPLCSTPTLLYCLFRLDLETEL